MINLVIWTALLILNLYFGIDDVRKKKPANWRVALTWSAVGTSWLMLIKAAVLFF